MKHIGEAILCLGVLAFLAFFVHTIYKVNDSMERYTAFNIIKRQHELCTQKIQFLRGRGVIK